MKLPSVLFPAALVLAGCSTIEDTGSLQARATQGSTDAQVELGHRYFSGKEIPQNYREGIRWWTKAAEGGNAEAQWLLGGCYEIGYDEPKDLDKAIAWWRRAASQGYAKAQFDLGNCYHYGKGVGRDLTQAYVWYSLAAEGGSSQGRTHRDKLAPQLSPAQLAEAKAHAAKIMAAHRG